MAPSRTRLLAVLADPQHRIAIQSVTGGLIGRVSIFVALTVYATITNAPEFIAFSTLYLVVQSVVGIFSAPLSTSIAASTAAAGVWRRGLVRQAAPVTVGLTVLTAAVAPFATSLLTQKPPESSASLIALACGATVATDAVLGALAGQGKTREVMFGDAARGVLGACAILGFGYLYGPLAAVVAVTGSELLVTIVLFGAVADQRRFRRRGRTIDHALTSTGVASNLSIQVAMFAHQALMSAFYGPAIIAAFTIANRFASFSILLPMLLTKNTVGLLGRAAGQSRDAFWHAFKKYAAQVSALTLVTAVAAPLAALLFFRPLLDKYPPSGALLIVLTVAGVPSALATALGTFCIVRRRLRIWLASDLCFLVVVPVFVLAVHAIDLGPVTAMCALPVGYLAIVLARSPILSKGGSS